MKHYIGKRILLFLPTLIVISVLAFALSVNAPGNPIERMLVASYESAEQVNSTGNFADQKKIWQEKLGLNLPLFYVEISDFASPDTLYKIAEDDEKVYLKRLLNENGNWETVSHYYTSILKLNANLIAEMKDSLISNYQTKTELNTSLNLAKSALFLLKSKYTQTAIEGQFKQLEFYFSKLNCSLKLRNDLAQLKLEYVHLKHTKSTWKNYIPTLHFYAQNQYHRWLFGDGNWWNGANSQFSKGIVRGDFGTSYASKEAVSLKIWERLKVSLFFALLSVFFAYLISIPIAIKAASKPHLAFDTWSSIALFSLYSLPSFFLATLLLMVFANPDVLNWFPASGLMPASGIPEGTSFFAKIKIQLPYVILPLICFTYSSLAFLSRSLRSALLENLLLDYVRTARAKGLSERIVLYKHAFKNALLPLITLFANVFPYAIGGSVILETIFTLPGMGLETYTAIQNQDYPVLIAVFTITGFMALLGTLLTDILYAFVDPRISFSQST